MLIALTADWHFNDWLPFSKVVKYKKYNLNSRLVDTIKTFHTFYGECMENKVDLVINLGDIFHMRNRFNMFFFNTVFNAFQNAAHPDLRTWILPGNHDIESKNSDPLEASVYAFDAIDTMTVFAKPGIMEYSGNTFYFMPYTGSKEVRNKHLAKFQRYAKKNKKGLNIFLYHGIVTGAALGGVKAKGGIPLRDLKPFDFAFCGDVHIHQALGLGNVVYTGAPQQHNFGDEGQKRGYVLFDTETKEWTFKPLKSPKFYKTDKLKKAVRLSRKGHFISYTPKTAKKQMEARSIIQAENLNFEVGTVASQERNTEMDVKGFLKPERLVKTWVKDNHKGKKKLLTKAGLSYLKGRRQ